VRREPLALRSWRFQSMGRNLTLASGRNGSKVDTSCGAAKFGSEVRQHAESQGKRACLPRGASAFLIFEDDTNPNYFPAVPY